MSGPSFTHPQLAQLTAGLTTASEVELTANTPSLSDGDPMGLHAVCQSALDTDPGTGLEPVCND